jgi:LL-diaminopimelate aminotransferase
MIRLNPHYLKLQTSYLFADIARRVNAHQAANPQAEIIKLGIGDVTRPLPAACVAALHAAVDEMAAADTFRGYGPEQGYPFLRELIARNDYQRRGADIQPDEIFISDGAKCDTGNFQELLAVDAAVGIPDPVYPVYVDTNVMAGRTGPFADGRYQGIVYLEGNQDNGFVPSLPAEPVDLVYLCYPNNPTGATISRPQLTTWVDWARENKALILYDAAYEAFIRDPDLPRTIYEIPGARDVAVEFAAFPKPPDSQEPAAPSRLCPNPAASTTIRAPGTPCTDFGTAVIRPNSTGSPIRSRKRPRQPIRPRGGSRSRR